MDKRYLVLAVVFVGALVMIQQKKAGATGAAGGTSGGPREIFPDGDTNGWRYFEGGTAISPDGTYYQNGAVAWYPTM